MGTATFYIAHVSLLLITALFIATSKNRENNRLRRYFLIYLVELFMWTACVLAQSYCASFGNTNLIIIFENLVYIGVSTIVVSILMIGRTFYYSGEKKQTYSYAFIYFIIPIITQIVIWTNPLHHFFYITYDFFDRNLIEVGWYFYIHTIYSYSCLLIGMYYIVRFTVKSIGDAFWQALLICIGTVIPLVVNVCYTFGIGNFTVYSTPVAFIITMLTYFLGVSRFSLLRISPIALKTVINKTSDLYIVIDENMKIIDYNEPFYSVFFAQSGSKRKEDIIEALDAHGNSWMNDEDFRGIVYNCRETRQSKNLDLKLNINEEINYYTVEFSPVIIDDSYCGCIILLKDITQATKDMEEIKQNHHVIIEQERLASIGQLMGGIAHNLKTPIMAITGRTENLNVLIDEYEESIGNSEVTVSDHMEIAGEMRQEIEQIRNQMFYISDVITAVKDQTIKTSSELQEFFVIEDLVERIDILMQHELIRNNCELVFETRVSNELEITGNINSLVQVINNIVLNAIHAYNGVKGQIRLKISQASSQEIVFSISDDADGIPADIQPKLFEQMITTKGKDGTGLGLYISHSTVVGMFGGKLWFNSIEGKGTDFFVSIPLRRLELYENN